MKFCCFFVREVARPLQEYHWHGEAWRSGQMSCLDHFGNFVAGSIPDTSQPAYLGMEEISHADALNLEAAVRRIMKDWNLEGNNMVGLGTDGASVMTCRHHSLQSLLSCTWPHVIHNSCTNHALDLEAKGAVQAALPSSMECILKVSFKWFSNSASRIEDCR